MPGDTNGDFDVFVRDRQAGTTELVSTALHGGSGNSSSYGPVISGDGRFVSFVSFAKNLVPGPGPRATRRPTSATCRRARPRW